MSRFGQWVALASYGTRGGLRPNTRACSHQPCKTWRDAGIAMALAIVQESAETFLQLVGEKTPMSSRTASGVGARDRVVSDIARRRGHRQGDI